MSHAGEGKHALPPCRNYAVGYGKIMLSIMRRKNEEKKSPIVIG